MMNQNGTIRGIWSGLLAALLAGPLTASAQQGEPEPAVQGAPGPGVQTIRFVEDDAQNYMVSKIYELKHQKANDLVPFILGAVKRYAKNSSADRINYSAGKQQLISVSCPVPMMPYVDDMIAKLDRPSKPDRYGSGVEGTGITRSVYTPQYRSSEEMMNVMIKAGISSNASEGANQDAVVAFDKHTGLIYWKDSVNKDKDLKKYLTWLDRPVPQMTISLRVYQVRESDLTDVGLDYLAWKNGPGMNLFDVGAKYLEGSALTESFGPYGFFLCAPSFDLSFLRILQQNGKASLATSANLTLVSGANGSMSFTPDYQNLKKDDKFASSVAVSVNDGLTLAVNSPAIAIGADAATLNFQYVLTGKQVVERDSSGNELIESTSSTGAATLQAGNEKLLSAWEKEVSAEQTIGVPFLCELPVLKYIFGTTTSTTEKVHYFLTVKAERVNPDTALSQVNGKLVSIPELVK